MSGCNPAPPAENNKPTNQSIGCSNTTSENSDSARLPLVLTAGGVPSRLPTLSACESVASRKSSSRGHRDNTRTDAILVAFASDSLRVWCARENRIGRQRVKDFGLFPEARGELFISTGVSTDPEKKTKR
jgi:hypothetical protein